MTHDLAQMTSPEAREAMAASRTVVLPIGSIEQHGPHLPNGTDTMAAELVAMEVADRLDAVYAPFCPYGVTPDPRRSPRARSTCAAPPSRRCSRTCAPSWSPPAPRP